MKLRAQLLSGFSVILVLTVILAGIAYQRIDSLVETQSQISVTHEIISKTHLIEKLLVDMETGERGYLITGKDEFLEPYNAAFQEYDTTLAGLKSLVSHNLQQVKRLEEIDALVTRWEKEAGEPLIAERKKIAGDTVNADHTWASMNNIVDLVAKETGKSIMDSLRAKIGEFNGTEEELLAAHKQTAQTAATMSNYTMVFGTLLAVILGLAAMFLISRNIFRMVGGEPAVIAAMAERVAQGNLDIELGGEGRVSIGIMGSVADMTRSLREQIGEISEGAGVLASSAKEITALSAQLVASSTESSTAVSQTTSTAEEVRQTAQTTTEKAKQISTGFQETVQISQEGDKSTEEATKQMNLIREQMESVAESIVRLSEQSQMVGEIISSVDDIAEQSNLLAVNAAVEAARAGDQGKGFAVVAEEIKNLAEQSKRATTQVRGILNDIQKATSNAVMVTEQGAKVVDIGSERTGAAGEAIRRLTDNVSESAQAASQIAAASNQQLAGMEQITQAMESIKQASEQNVSGTRQLEEASRNLEELGEKLQELVRRYKV
ncbi:MAG: methyl-accepting chemotaxis protein [bacterium]